MPVIPLASSSWKFRDVTEKSPWLEEIVPVCVHHYLRRHELIPDPFYGTNELYPHENKDIYVEFAEPITVAAIKGALTHHSLGDTY